MATAQYTEQDTAQDKFNGLLLVLNYFLAALLYIGYELACRAIIADE